MAFIDCPGIAEVTLFQTLRGESCLNVFHYTNGTGDNWTLTDLQALANQVMTNWLTAGTGMKDHQGTELSVLKTIVRDLSYEAGLQATSTVSGGGGASGTAAMENSLSPCVSLHTGFSGKSYRGRLYIAGFRSDGLLDANHLTSAVAADTAADLFQTLQTGITVSGADLVVLSRYHNKAPRLSGIGTLVTSMTCDTRLDNQRRRMPRN